MAQISRSLPLSFVLLLLHLQSHLVDSSCLQHHYNNSALDTCYIVVKPQHIYIARTQMDFWGDNAAIANEDESYVIKNREQAERACKGLPTWKGDRRDFFFPEDKTEIDDFGTKLDKLAKNKTMKQLGLAQVDSDAELKFLLYIAYKGSRSRRGGSAFLGNFLGYHTMKFANYAPTNMEKIREKYNIDESQANGCAMIRFDPGLPELQGLFWVSCQDPYKSTLAVKERSRNVICTYGEQGDCHYYRVKKECYYDRDQQQCWQDRSYKIRNQTDLGRRCLGASTPKNTGGSRCSPSKMFECNSNCTWGPWKIGSKDYERCKPGCKGTRVRYRELMEEQFVAPGTPGDPGCDDMVEKNIKEKRDCKDPGICDGANNNMGGVIGMGLIIGVVGLIFG